MRPGEVDGIDYFFQNKSGNEQLIEQGELILEYALGPCDNYYDS